MTDTTHNRHRRKQSHTSRKAIRMRKAMRQEIDELRTKVRTAYTLEAQINVCGYEATEEELELISERTLNTKILEKLETIYFNHKTDTPPLFEHHLYRENLILLHFFYLVRLAQQGFLYLISGAYPDLEPEAVVYLCDKMVGASVYLERSHHGSDRQAFRDVAYELMRNLVEQKDEPVAEGFRTTYKQINNVIQSLIFKATDPEQQNSAKPNITTIPPIWVVSPIINMLDNKTFAVPGAIPTLPFPSAMLPVSNPNTFPSAAGELKEQNDMLKQERKAAKKESDAKKLAKKENDAKLEAEKESAAKELATKQVNGHAEEEQLEADEDDDSEEDEDYEDGEDEGEFSDHYYNDRFADADTSDESEEEQEFTQASVDKTPVKEVELAKSNSQASTGQASQILNSQAPSSPATSQTSISHTNQATTNKADQPSVSQSSQASEEPEVPKANSSWLNYAAASPRAENTSGPTSPRDNNRGNKPYHVNPRY